MQTSQIASTARCLPSPTLSGLCVIASAGTRLALKMLEDSFCSVHAMRVLSKVQTAIPLDCKKTSQRLPSCASERTQSKENKTSCTADRRIRKPQPTTHRNEDLEPESIQIPHFLQKLRTRVKLCACQYVCLKCIHHWHYMAQINPLAIQGGKVQGTAYLQRSVLLHELASCL